MRIHTLWKMWDDDGLELCHAVDDATLAENPDAWEDGVLAACKRYGITEGDMRAVIVDIPSAPIFKAFQPTEVAGTIALEDQR